MTTKPTVAQQRAIAYSSKPFTALSLLASLYVLQHLIKNPNKTTRMYHRLIGCMNAFILVQTIFILWGNWVGVNFILYLVVLFFALPPNSVLTKICDFLYHSHVGPAGSARRDSILCGGVGHRADLHGSRIFRWVEFMTVIILSRKVTKLTIEVEIFIVLSHIGVYFSCIVLRIFEHMLLFFSKIQFQGW